MTVPQFEGNALGRLVEALVVGSRDIADWPGCAAREVDGCDALFLQNLDQAGKTRRVHSCHRDAEGDHTPGVTHTCACGTEWQEVGEP